MAAQRRYFLFLVTSFLQLKLSGSEDFLPCKLFYWDAPPYTYFNRKTNTTEGMFIDMIKAGKDSCQLKSCSVHRIAGDFAGYYDFFTSNRTEIDTTLGKQVFNATIDVVGPFVTTEPNLQEHGLREIKFFSAPSIAVIMPRWRVQLLNKIAMGVMRCKNIITVSVLLSVCTGILIWLIEHFRNNEFSRSFIRGGGTGFWWSVVTLTTVGYGDITPKSMLGRAIGIAWVIFGVMLGAIITATVTDAVTGTGELAIDEKEVAVLINSFESHYIQRDYNAKSKNYTSYADVLEAVRQEEVYAGIMNSDFAAYYLVNETNKDYSLIAAYTIEKELPVGLWVPIAGGRLMDITTYAQKVCMEYFEDTVYKWSLLNSRRALKITSLDMDQTLKQLFEQSMFAKVLCGLTLGFVTLGLIFEAIYTKYKDKSKWLQRLPRAGTVTATSDADALLIIKSLQKQLSEVQADLNSFKQQGKDEVWSNRKTRL